MKEAGGKVWVIIGEKGVEPMAISNQLDRLSPNPMTLSESRIGDKDLSAYCAGPKLAVNGIPW